MDKIRVELDLPNIVMEIPEDKYDASYPIEYRYAATYKTFLMEAAKQFPQWTFVQEWNYYTTRESTDPDGNTTRRYLLDTFDVLDGREKLGTVQARFNRRAPCIHLSNSRIYNDVERGNGRETKDIPKAIRFMKKYFGVKTLQESVKEALSETHRAVRYTHSEKAGVFRRHYAHMCDHLSDYLMQNIKTLIPKAESAGASPSMVRSLPEAWEQAKITGDLEQCYTNEKGVVVYLHGQNYAVSKLDETLRIYTADDAPDILKRKLGLLKLVEDGQCITEVGMRVTEKIYFVMEELF